MTGAGPLLSAFPQLKDSQFFPPSTTTGSLVIGPGTSRMGTKLELNLNREKFIKIIPNRKNYKNFIYLLYKFS